MMRRTKATKPLDLALVREISFLLLAVTGCAALLTCYLLTA